MLNNKVALVTGSAKRTGKAIVEALAENGAEVIIHYNRSELEARQVVEAICAKGGKATALQAELSDVSQVNKLIFNVLEKCGKLDILVNNVGNYLVKDIDKISPEEWDEQIKTTVSTTFYTCQAALPHMVKQKFGRIINMADSGADHISPWPEATPYMVGKTGVLILSKSLAAHYAKYNITVNCISPGILDNSIWKPQLQGIPAGRYAEYSDVTNAVLFLLKDESTYITGANIKVSGGWCI